MSARFRSFEVAHVRITRFLRSFRNPKRQRGAPSLTRRVTTKSDSNPSKKRNFETSASGYDETFPEAQAVEGQQLT
jgi:hypothetical protein